MAVKDKVTFWEMFRELPGRTTVASFVPVILGVAQLLNGYFHGIPMTHTAGFAAVMLVAAVLVTRYHLVAFHRLKLQRNVFGERGPLFDE